MSIEQLDLMLCDMYVLDVWMPSSFFKTEFQKASYSIWAIDELKGFIAAGLYPRTYGAIDEIINITGEFIGKMNRYIKINPNNRLMFSVARDVATDIQELLRAMR